MPFEKLESIKPLEVPKPEGQFELPDRLGKPEKMSELPDSLGNEKMSELPERLSGEKGAENLNCKGNSEAPNELRKNDQSLDIAKLSENGGGSYKEVLKYAKKENLENKEVHHMPADSSSRLERGDGPCIIMEKEDHRKTASCGNSREARDYRAVQRDLIQNGQFMKALQLDIDDIKSKFGNKYDVQIEEMLKYVDQLKEAEAI